MADEKEKPAEPPKPKLSPVAELIVERIMDPSGHPWVLMRKCFEASFTLTDQQCADSDKSVDAMRYISAFQVWIHLVPPAQRSYVNAQEQSALWIVCMKDNTVSNI